jgi:hypothetical protein
MIITACAHGINDWLDKIKRQRQLLESITLCIIHAEKKAKTELENILDFSARAPA